MKKNCIVLTPTTSWTLGVCEYEWMEWHNFVRKTMTGTVVL